MINKNVIPVACCLSLFAGCASNQPADNTAWSVAPTASAKISSASPASMYQLGRYYQGQNRYELAIDAYQKALAADANYVEARNGLGVVYSRQGKYPEAIEAFTTALQQAPDAAHIYSNLGYTYYLQGSYNDSITMLQKAVELSPSNQRALNNLGLAYAKMGRAVDSEQAFAKAGSVSTVVSVAGESPAQAPAIQQRLAIIPVEDNRMTLVQLAPSVYELRDQRRAEPVQMRTVVDVPVPEKIRVEVSNGNGVPGMAKKVGRFLRSLGYPAARLTNQNTFRVLTTQIQYREGYEAAAKRLQDSLSMKPELVQAKDLRLDIKLRLVLGKDAVDRLDDIDRAE